MPIFDQLSPEYKEAFALFDKRGKGTVPRETLGDLLRALGQNPTQTEVAEIVASAPRDGTRLSLLYVLTIHSHTVDYKTFLTILNRPDGFKPAGTPGTRPCFFIFVVEPTHSIRGIYSWIPGV